MKTKINGEPMKQRTKIDSSSDFIVFHKTSIKVFPRDCLFLGPLKVNKPYINIRGNLRVI